MCGIAGFFLFDNSLSKNENLKAAINTLNKRGPDAHNIYLNKNVGLAHSRLSIIDTTTLANQPFTDASGRYVLVFNGEIFNYLQLQKQYLSDKNIAFISHSDTEVLLYLLIHYGTTCLNWLSGFFAFALYDMHSEKMVLARDRYGKKPLHIYYKDNQFVFASELKALMAYGIDKEIDFSSLQMYLQLNYLPQPYSILKNCSKLPAAHYLEIDNTGVGNAKAYYKLEDANNNKYTGTYENAKNKLNELVENAVTDRLISDVPLGAFLSGGIDSSVVVGLASRHVKNLHTFSIGYADEPYFDETNFAQLVAQKFKTNHTVFKLTNADMFEIVHEMLDYIDEPFADSCSIAMYILSKRTRKAVTVALSGDGADEVFAGYHKYAAEYMIQQGGAKINIIKNLQALWSILPKGRNNKFLNIIRQLHRFANGANLSNADRHWLWCSLMNEDAATKLLLNFSDESKLIYQNRKNDLLHYLINAKNADFNNNLLTDINLVLQGDMLVKVDSMSMANSLEVRSPFLDYKVVDFANSLPVSFKINGSLKKRIVQDAFRDLLPPELYNRPKKGFEVPILKWLNTDLHNEINNTWLQKDFIQSQNIFDNNEIIRIKNKLKSNNPGDATGNMWALIVFQNWYIKYFLK